MKRKTCTKLAAATPARPSKVARTPAERALAQRMLEQLRTGADVRSRKVRRIKAAIKVRHYENALKLAVALDRMSGAAKRLRS